MNALRICLFALVCLVALLWAFRKVRDEDEAEIRRRFGRVV